MLRPPSFRGLRCLLIAGVAVCLAACTTGVSDRDVDKSQVSVGEVRRLMAEGQRRNKDVILLVDPRPASEYAKGHIPGARNIPLSSMHPKAAIDRTISRYDNIIVYGTDPAGASARAMAKRLMANKYDNVALFSGGLVQWAATGGEVEVSTPPPGQSSTPATSTPPG